MENASQEVRKLKALANFLDSKFKLPLGIRIGWDSILGFIPGIGDLATNIVSFYIILRAARLGCPPSVLLHMGFNVFLDNLFDVVPFLGNFFDIFWKANNRNVALVENYFLRPSATKLKSALVLIVTLAFIALMLAATVTLVITAALWVFNSILNSIH